MVPSDAAGTVAVGAVAHVDDDNDQDTIPTDFPEGTGFVLSGTYNLPLLNGSTFVGNIVVGPSGCGAPGTSVYNFARNVVLNMTEAVNLQTWQPSQQKQVSVDRTTFQLRVQNWIQQPDGNCSGPGDGWNNDHLS